MIVCAIALTAALVISPSSGISHHPHAVDHRTIAVERPSRHASMRGELPSTYHGQFWTRRSDDFWKCVRSRESHGFYAARNPSSSAQGSMQWLDRSWRRGLAHMATLALQKDGTLTHRQALTARTHLRGIPIASWSREVQDAAAFASMNWNGELSNARHWYLSGSPCNRLGGMG